MPFQPLGLQLEAGALLVPGIYDAFSALAAQQAGFTAAYLSGASIAYTHLGRSDVGLTTFTEVLQTLSAITDRVSMPIIVDADTGFGDIQNTIRTVKGFEKAGASMIQLEDQTYPKRCGHLENKTIIPAVHMCSKLKAALDARTRDTTLILARTDALAPEGLEAAMDRAERYLECGADALFIEALPSVEAMQEAARRFASRVHLLVNMVEGGKTPILPFAQLRSMGFRMVIYPGGAVRAIAPALRNYYDVLRADGSSASYMDRMCDFQSLNTIIETPKLLARMARYTAAEDVA